MKIKLFAIVLTPVVFVVAAVGIYLKTRPSPFDTGNPLLASHGPIKLFDGFSAEPLSEGWAHRKFLTVSAADYELIDDEGAAALRCKTDNSASILARDTNIPLSSHPTLSWSWKVITPIDSDVDETTEAGDDHPVRFFLTFSNENNEKKSMEIIWSNRKFAPGDYKIIGSFYHYVANGLNENIGQWHEHSVDLGKIYEEIGGIGTPTLDTLGFFCDSDNTGETSEGLFKDVVLLPSS